MAKAIIKVSDGCGKSWFYVVDHGYIVSGIEKHMDTCRVYHVIDPGRARIAVEANHANQKVRIEVPSSNRCYIKAAYGDGTGFAERDFYSLEKALLAAGATANYRSDLTPDTYEGSWSYEVGEAQVAIFRLEGSCIEQRLLGA